MKSKLVVADTDALTVRPGREVTYHSPAAAPRVENPDHDSLVQRFDQLERLLTSSVKSKRLGDALKLVKLIRAQVLK